METSGADNQKYSRPEAQESDSWHVRSRERMRASGKKRGGGAEGRALMNPVGQHGQRKEPLEKEGKQETQYQGSPGNKGP
ncbi:hypothetical protein AAY473_035584 [Plecturocebus cupreus]